jgi:V/A-type H+-transporting ATPase subunit E
MAAPELPSVGVQSLIERLRAEGLEAGRQEAQQLLEAARAEAAAILSTARQEAERVAAETAEAVRRERASAAASFELARRDALLRLREDIERQLVRRLHELAGAVTADPAAMSQLALQVLRRTIGVAQVQAGAASGVGVSARNDDTAPDLLIGALLCEPGMQEIHVERRTGAHRGLRLQIGAGAGELQLDEETLGALLAERVLPRFRRMLEGLGPTAS